MLDRRDEEAMLLLEIVIPVLPLLDIEVTDVKASTLLVDRDVTLEMLGVFIEVPGEDAAEL